MQKYFSIRVFIISLFFLITVLLLFFLIGHFLTLLVVLYLHSMGIGEHPDETAM